MLPIRTDYKKDTERLIPLDYLQQGYKTLMSYAGRLGPICNRDDNCIDGSGSTHPFYGSRWTIFDGLQKPE